MPVSKFKKAPKYHSKLKIKKGLSRKTKKSYEIMKGQGRCLGKSSV